MRLNAPRPVLRLPLRHTNTSLSRIQHMRKPAHTHISLAFCCPACWLIDRCSPGPWWHSWPVPADQTTSAAPSGVHKRVCTPGLLWWRCSWTKRVSEWQEKNLRTFGVPAPFVCVSEWLPRCLSVCGCVCMCVRENPCYANQPPLPSKSAYISVVVCMSPSSHHSCFQSCWMPKEGSADILGFSVTVSSVFSPGLGLAFFLVFFSVVYFLW